MAHEHKMELKELRQELREKEEVIDDLTQQLEVQMQVCSKNIFG